MKLQYLTQDALDFLSAGFEDNKEHYIRNDKQWFMDMLQEMEGLVTLNIDFPELVMNMDDDYKASKPDYNLSDFTNIRIMYDALRGLPQSMACDPRFWVGLTHTVLWDYVWYRRYTDIKGDDIDQIKSSFFLKYLGRRGLFVNCVSRLWWAGYLSYDSKCSDPYELTKVFASKAFPSMMLLISSRNYSSNKNVLRGIFRAVRDCGEEGHEIKRQIFEKVLVYLNNISAAMILDFLSEDEIYGMAMEELHRN